MAERVTKATFEKVFKRDGERCVFCKSYIALQLHHINGRGVGKTDDPDNCVIVCRNCHERIHEKNEIYRPYLNRYIARKKKQEERRKKKDDNR